MAEPMAPAPIIAMSAMRSDLFMFTSPYPAIHISFPMPADCRNRAADRATNRDWRRNKLAACMGDFMQDEF
jgi:hypothetical protein